VRLVFEQRVDPAAERERLAKDLKKMEIELANAQRQLTNEQFLAKAPAPVVDGIRRRAAELTVLMEKSQEALTRVS
jgi:valyl-tRNA synthetase